MLDFSEFFPQGMKPPIPLKGDGFLIHGVRRCGKTSFAFQAAVNCVLQGGYVIILCHESALYANIPKPFISLSTLTEEALHRIEFIYVSNWAEATKEMMAMRNVQDLPTLLLVDDNEFNTMGTENASEPAGRRILQRCAKYPGANDHGSMVIALSQLSNMADWLRRSRVKFHYIIVTNIPISGGITSSEKDCFGHRLPLPYVSFPVVSIFIDPVGVVHVVPVLQDVTEVKPIHLQWNNGLRLTEA